MPLRLIQRLELHARQRPDAPAIVQVGGGDAPERSVAWRDLRNRVAALGAFLRLRLPRGATVILSCPNCIEYTAAFLALLDGGFVVLAISPELTAVEYQSAAAESGAAAVLGAQAARQSLAGHVAHAISLEELASAAEAAADAPMAGLCGNLLLQSSGTTSRPKLVLRSGASLDAMAENLAAGVGYGPDDRVLAGVPVCHSYGVEQGLLAPTWAGSCVALVRGFDLPLITRQLAEGRITIFPGVPFMFEALAQGSQGGFGKLRCAYSAGSPLPPAVYAACEQRLGLRVSQLYGATEIGSVTFASPADPHFDPASVGRPLRGVSIRILDAANPQAERPLPAGTEGHVAVAAPSMLTRYLGDEPAPLVDGHFLTGDLGRLDQHGALTITGRIKLLIDVGGLKVNPLEVEAVLAQHPAVAACAVVPVRLSETVSRLKAIVLPRGSAPQNLAEELRRFARQRLTGYKVPRVFEVRGSLPRSPSGKILRHLLDSAS